MAVLDADAAARQLRAQAVAHDADVAAARGAAEQAEGRRRQAALREAAAAPTPVAEHAHAAAAADGARQPSTITTKKRQFEFLKKGDYSTQQTFHTFDLLKCQTVNYCGTKKALLRLFMLC